MGNRAPFRKTDLGMRSHGPKRASSGIRHYSTVGRTSAKKERNLEHDIERDPHASPAGLRVLRASSDKTVHPTECRGGRFWELDHDIGLAEIETPPVRDNDSTVNVLLVSTGDGQSLRLTDKGGGVTGKLISSPPAALP